MSGEIKTNPLTHEEWTTWLNRIRTGELEPPDCASVILHEIEKANAEAKRLHDLIWSPHVDDFLEAVRIEAAHQRDRWGEEHDGIKDDPDWYWLVGWVAGKAVHAASRAHTEGTPQEKRLHHIITSAAVCLNWHRHAKEKPLA